MEVINGSEPSFGFSVWKVPDAITLADIEAQGIQEVGGDNGENQRGILRPGGVDRELMVVLDVSGTWGMVCFTLLPGTVRTGEEFAAAVVEVR
jgi:chemotaxis signal transduction protein